MKNIWITVLLFYVATSFAQREASIWYFGWQAGIRFNPDNTVTVLTDSQITTGEGCATISNGNGDLLFYTDGITIWDKNHIIMPNADENLGTGLFGDSSSTQSAIIVPNPGNLNQYFVFTVDEPQPENAAVYPNAFLGTYFDHTSTPNGDDGLNNGLNYSIVDLSIIGSNGSIGDVVQRNNHLITYNPNPTGEEIKYKCSEKITAIKDEVTNSYWVITQFVDKFYAFKITNSGVVSTPVISTIGPSVGLEGYRRNAQGYLKANTSGTQIAIAHKQINTMQNSETYNEGFVYVFDFDKTSGVVSNPKMVLSGVAPYGVEFSPSGDLLYCTYQEVDTISGLAQAILSQFNLTSLNIAASKIALNSYDEVAGALQMALDGKIYYSLTNSQYLGVINNPNILGTGCNYVPDSIFLEGYSTFGLPPFVSSFLQAPAIQYTAACLGDSTQFTVTSSQPILSVNWDFGDGSTSTTLIPTHIYATAGNYTVTATVTTALGTATNTRTVIINTPPVLLQSTATLQQCDDDTDGFSYFNLNESIPLFVNNTNGLTFSFHETQTEAENDTNAINSTTAYPNALAVNDVVYLRVKNDAGCFATATLNLHIATTQLPNTFALTYHECDDMASGSITDGITVFDFSDANTQIQNQFPAGQQLIISYHENIADALAGTNAVNPAHYINTTSNNQTIFVRVEDSNSKACLGLGNYILLHVDTIPVIQPLQIVHCDDNQDGFFPFDTTNLQATLLNGLTNVIVTYQDVNGTILPSPLPNPFVSNTQTITATVTNVFGRQCNYNTTINFVVDKLPEIFAIPTALTTKCDDETDSLLQDDKVDFDTSAFQQILIGNQTNVIVKYYDGNNNLLPTPLSNPFHSATQNIKVEISNATNSTCKAIGIIPLMVIERPKIFNTATELICSDNPAFIRTIDAGLQQPSLSNNYTYTWFFNGNAILNQNQYTLQVNTPGTYVVTITNSQGCSSNRTVTVTASEKAHIDDVIVTDLEDENSILVLASGLGNYSYSLDNQNYQTSNFFDNLASGIYTIYVKDEKGCGTITNQVSVLAIPKFFTPNGDGHNDYWNLKGNNFLKEQLLTIYIYDRFGKLIKQFTNQQQGWDGTYNNELLPADDYWYNIKLSNNQIKQGHFTLKR